MEDHLPHTHIHTNIGFAGCKGSVSLCLSPLRAAALYIPSIKLNKNENWHFPSAVVMSAAWRSRARVRATDRSHVSLKRLMTHRDKRCLLAAGKSIRHELEATVIRNWLQNNWKENDLADKFNFSTESKSLWKFKLMSQIEMGGGQLEELRLLLMGMDLLDYLWAVSICISITNLCLHYVNAEKTQFRNSSVFIK